MCDFVNKGKKKKCNSTAERKRRRQEKKERIFQRKAEREGKFLSIRQKNEAKKYMHKKALEVEYAIG